MFKCKMIIMPHDSEETLDSGSVFHEYDSVLQGILNELAPVRTRLVSLHPNAPWYNSDIALGKRLRERLERINRPFALRGHAISFL